MLFVYHNVIVTCSAFKTVPPDTKAGEREPYQPAVICDPGLCRCVCIYACVCVYVPVYLRVYTSCRIPLCGRGLFGGKMLNTWEQNTPLTTCIVPVCMRVCPNRCYYDQPSMLHEASTRV